MRIIDTPSAILLVLGVALSGVAVYTGCTDSTHLRPAAAADIAAINAVACPLWMPLVATAVGAGPLAGALTCVGEEAAVNALLTEFTAKATPDAGAGLGFAVAAMTVAPRASAGLVPVRKANGKAVLLAPAALAPQLQVAQASIDARGSM
jgi:hypothetical protein